MLNKTLWFLFAFFALAIGLYPALYFFIDRSFGLLSSKPAELLVNAAWNTGFYVHIVGGGLALLSGWIQFSARMRRRRPALHRFLGKIYVFSVLPAALAGIYIAFYATGGFVAAAGFICLGLVWFSTTLAAYRSIRNRDIDRHRRLMTYSYAACFAAVTLRLWLPLLTAVFHDFIPAYRLVAWLCWVPNLLVAAWILRTGPREMTVSE